MKRVVIIGASFAGLSAYLGLRNLDLDVTLFDAKPHFEYVPGLHEAINDDQRLHQLRIDLSKHYKNVFIHATVNNITSKYVYANGKKYPYDYLIIATGAKTNWYGNEHFKHHLHQFKTGEHVQAINKQLPKAKTVTVVGGGYTGVEVASVLAGLPKRINIVHAGPRLLHTMPKSISNRVHKYFKQHHIHMYLNDPLIKCSTRSLTLRSGTTLSSDLTIYSAGIAPNDDLLGKHTLTSHLNISKRPNIFLCGDVARSGILSTAHNAMIEGRHVARQIAHHLKTDRYINIAHRNWTTLAIALGKQWGIIPVGPINLYMPFVGLSKKIIEKRVLFEFKNKKRLPV